MRNILVYIVLFLYTTLFAVGVPLTVHYCDGAFAGINLVEEDDCCGETTSGDCCKNETAYIKADNSHHATVQLQTPAVYCLWLPPSPTTWDLQTTLTNGISTGTVLSDESPPPQKVFVLHNNFRL